MSRSTAPLPPVGHLTLRPVTEADGEFLLELYGSTRAEELDQVAWAPGQREAFVRMQLDAQNASYRAQNPEGTFDVIESDGEPLGRLYVDRRPDEIRIVDISLLPQFRRRGIGSVLIGRLQAEAAGSGRALTIHVEVHNPAITLYERLGFVPVAEHGLYRLMEWTR